MLHKKKGDYAKSAEYLSAALEIKPEGHLGVGDLYVKEVEYLAALEEETLPVKTFVGYRYGKSGPRELEFEEQIGLESRVEKLIHADRHFADALLVLGDLKAQNRTLNMALWAFVRAEQLGHQNPEAVEGRISSVFRRWREVAGHRGSRVEKQSEAIAAIRADLEKAEAWVESFETVEAKLIAERGLVDFDAVTAEMKKRGIEKVRPKDRGIVRRSLLRFLASPRGIILFVAIACLIAWFVKHLRLRSPVS